MVQCRTVLPTLTETVTYYHPLEPSCLIREGESVVQLASFPVIGISFVERIAAGFISVTGIRSSGRANR